MTCPWRHKHNPFHRKVESKEVLEKEVKPLVTEFLWERGLELSEEKTSLTHIEEGFDFLGQTVRKYNGQFLTLYFPLNEAPISSAYPLAARKIEVLPSISQTLRASGKVESFTNLVVGGLRPASEAVWPLKFSGK